MKNISRIFDIIYYQLENHPIDHALVTKQKGKWEFLSTQEYVNRVNQLSRGLLKLGIEQNDKIAVITTANYGEWNILDMGLLQIGAQNVPIYPTSSSEDYAYILKHSEAKYVFVSDQAVLKKVNKAIKETKVKEVFGFREIKNCKSWGSIFTLGEDQAIQEEVDKIKKNINPDDMATLIYTSGTTGMPKGVVLSHRNLVSNVLDSASRVPFGYGTEIALSFLPLCHVFERMLIYLYQYYSVSIYYAESIEAIPKNLKEIKPTFTTAVPRLLEKIYEAFYTKGNNLSGIKRNLFHWAIHLGKQYRPFERQSRFYNIQLKIAQKLVLSKWKDGVGGRLDLIVSGSAPLAPELSRIYAASGMLILEGYGLTETSPVIAVNTNDKEYFKIGTVGKPIDNVKVKIAKDGEILVKGPNVMKGYFKDDERTKENFNKEGYFCTGDIGNLDEDGFLKITDRKKQLFKTSGGKYISPQKIENELKKSRFIEHIIVLGEGEKMPAALIQPNFDFIKQWASHKNIDLGDDKKESVSENKKVIERIQKEIDSYSEEFGHWEQVKVFRLTPDKWSIKGGELTPTLKVKRKNIIKKYKSLYNSIYKK